jgi:hypothetical protein
LESTKQMGDLCFLYVVKKKKWKQNKKPIAFFQTEDWLKGQVVPFVEGRELKPPGRQNGNYSPVHAEQPFYEAGRTLKNLYGWL